MFSAAPGTGSPSASSYATLDSYPQTLFDAHVVLKLPASKYCSPESGLGVVPSEHYFPRYAETNLNQTKHCKCVSLVKQKSKKFMCCISIQTKHRKCVSLEKQKTKKFV